MCKNFNAKPVCYPQPVFILARKAFTVSATAATHVAKCGYEGNTFGDGLKLR